MFAFPPAPELDSLGRLNPQKRCKASYAAKNENLTFIDGLGRTHCGSGVTRRWRGKKLAEREGFEPPVRFPVHLISSQAPSTGLGHLSAAIQLVSRSSIVSQFLCGNVITTPPRRIGKIPLHNIRRAAGLSGRIGVFTACSADSRRQC